MRLHIAIAAFMLLVCFGGSPPSARAAVSAGVASDNIDAAFEYWPDRHRRAREFQTSGGHKYRVYKPQVTTTNAGGLLVTYTMDHDISNGRDDHAAVSMTFDPYGVLSAMQVTVRLAKASNTFQSAATIADLVGNGAAGSALGGAGQVGAAVALVAKGVAGISKMIGGQINQNGGTELMPYEVQFVSEQFAKAVHAAGHGSKLLHEGDAIQFWKGNACGLAGLGSFSGEARSVRLPSHDVPNDDIRAVRIYDNIPPGTTIRLFDDGSGSQSKDDWAEIKVIDPGRFTGVGECVATLERNRDDPALRVAYHKRKGRGNLDGHVSHVTVSPSG